MPEFYMILARNISKVAYPNFYNICPKNNKIPEFYTIFDRKCQNFT